MCKFMVHCQDLADKPHPLFLRQILSKEVQPICQCFGYLVGTNVLRHSCKHFSVGHDLFYIWWLLKEPFFLEGRYLSNTLRLFPHV